MQRSWTFLFACDEIGAELRRSSLITRGTQVARDMANEFWVPCDWR